MAFDDQRGLVPAAADGFPHLGRPETGPRTSDLMPRGEFANEKQKGVDLRILLKLVETDLESGKIWSCQKSTSLLIASNILLKSLLWLVI